MWALRYLPRAYGLRCRVPRWLEQTAYRILTASSERALAGNRRDLWDSEKVESRESTQVVYRGKPPVSQARAVWTVEVWDGDGKPGG